MKREALRVEPISTFLDRWKAPTSPVTRAGSMIFVAGLPPFDPETGELKEMPIERQSEIVMEQLKLCLRAAGASLDNVMKCNVYCTSTKHFAAFNTVYARYFPLDPPARIFVCTPEWFGPFDVEIDCIAMM
ncbi:MULTISPECIES: RidA family protein [Bradyrhizobium]|uniref:RidA family protein n=1 Tax=Bradyrhizobium TaxID=374 RepID=UPI001B8A450F|nr:MULTISPECIES: RidA family protein [Bradyrhizobium]MBR0975096.1 RidA family protein [Bradyrhizobium japonicum]